MKRRILSLVMAVLMAAVMLPGKLVSAEPNEADYYATSVTADNQRSDDGKKMGFSWTNPAVAPTAITVYTLTESGEWQAESDVDLSKKLAASAPVDFSRWDKETGKLYTYKVVFEFEGHEPTSLLLSAKPEKLQRHGLDNGRGVLIGDEYQNRAWGVANPTWGVDLNMSGVYIDTEEKHSGEASLHISTNYAESNNELRFLNYGSGMRPVKDEKYVLSGYYKANNYNSGTNSGFIRFGNDAQINGTHTSHIANGTTSEWKAFSIPFTIGKETNNDLVSILFARCQAQDLWLDDLVLQKEDGTKSFFKIDKTDLGGFEYFTPAETPMLQVEDMQGGGKNITLTPASDSKKMYLYESVGGADVIRAVLDPSSTSVTLDDATGDIKVSSKNDKNVMSEKVGVTIMSEADYYGYAPTFMPVGAGGSAWLSWRNPKAACSKVSLYDVTNPRQTVLVSNELSTAADKSVEQQVDGLTLGQQHLYKVVFEFVDHAETSLLIGGTAKEFATLDKTVGGSDWKAHVEDGKEGPVVLNIDTNMGYESSASLHVSSNPTDKNGWLELRYDMPKNKVNDAVGKKYTLSMRVKANGYTPLSSLIGQIYTQGWWENNIETNFDWQEFSKEVTIKGSEADKADSSYPLVLIKLPQMNVKDMWIDNIFFGETNGENLIKGGDFESYTAAAEVIEPTVQSVGDGCATIGYAAPNNTKAVYVYQKVEDELVWRASVEDFTSVTIDGLTNGEENELMIKTLSTDYVLSEGVLITASIPIPKYSTGNYKLYDGDKQINTPTAGEMTVKLDVTNLQMGADFTPCYIVAAYDGDCLVDCVVSDKVTIGENETKTLSASVTVGADVKNCKIKAFLWKDYEKMGILKINGEF